MYTKPYFILLPFISHKKSVFFSLFFFLRLCVETSFFFLLTIFSLFKKEKSPSVLIFGDFFF